VRRKLQGKQQEVWNLNVASLNDHAPSADQAITTDEGESTYVGNVRSGGGVEDPHVGELICSGKPRVSETEAATF